MEKYQMFSPSKSTTNKTNDSLKLQSEVFLGLENNENSASSSGLAKDRELAAHNNVYKNEGGGSSCRKKIRNERYAFETRSHVDILDDGYRWRKYGQKAVKNNKFPRSYYRCTQDGCGVKKQIQRLTGDEAMVVTTYEGIHNHPVQKDNDNFQRILTQMQIYTPF